MTRCKLLLLVWLITGIFACSGAIGAGSPGAGPAADGGSDSAAADGGRDGGGSRCHSDGECDADSETCQLSTGRCLERTCLTDGCSLGEYCDLTTLTCSSQPPGDHPSYHAETLAGHNVQQHLSARDAQGLSALGEFKLIVAAHSGRYLYVVDNAVLRIDQATGRVETVSGLGWPGYVDGPAEIAQFETNFYQEGGLGISPDDRTLYVTTGRTIRRVDLEAGDVSTVAPPELEGASIRGMAVGAETGNLYVAGYGDLYAVIEPDGPTELRSLDSTSTWGAESNGSPPGYIVVDEPRGWVYGLDRNHLSGAFYRWPIMGGTVEWLNHEATGGRSPIQYLSDGPVARLDMANPGGLSIDAQGFVYIGAGDGRTFRRYNPDGELVESLCAAVGTEVNDGDFEWCIGDGERNSLFGTWPSILTFDDAGNGFFGYSVWPRLIRLRRVN